MAEIIMTAAECARRHLAVATEFRTMYAYAMYGWLITHANIDIKVRQNLNGWYTKNGGANEKKLRAVAGKGYWGFDCVNLTKGILWGWTGDATKSKGGAVAGAHGVPDTNANGMITYCQGVSTDFSSIRIGEGLWMEGHWGLYVGDGRAVECTNWKYKDGVQITAVANIGKISGLPSHTWTKHGMLPWLDYTNGGTVFIPLQNGSKGEAVRKMQEALLSLHYNLGRWGADGDFGAATENAVMAFQDDHGLNVTGIADEATMKALDNSEFRIKNSDEGTTSSDCLQQPPSPEGKAGAAAPADPGERWYAHTVNLTREEAEEEKERYGNRTTIGKMK